MRGGEVRAGSAFASHLEAGDAAAAGDGGAAERLGRDDAPAHARGARRARVERGGADADGGSGGHGGHRDGEGRWEEGGRVGRMRRRFWRGAGGGAGPGGDAEAAIVAGHGAFRGREKNETPRVHWSKWRMDLATEIPARKTVPAATPRGVFARLRARHLRTPTPARAVGRGRPRCSRRRSRPRRARASRPRRARRARPRRVPRASSRPRLAAVPTWMRGTRRGSRPPARDLRARGRS